MTRFLHLAAATLLLAAAAVPGCGGEEFTTSADDADAAAGAAGGAGSGGGAAGAGGTAGAPAGSGGSGGEPGGSGGAEPDGGVEDAAGTDGSTGPCPPGEKPCGQDCVSIDDPLYGCADIECDACTLPNAEPACKGGACAIESCSAGFADCDFEHATGCETSTASDPKHCGFCGNECGLLGAGLWICSHGQCEPSLCPAGKANCDAAPDCETTLGTLENCRFCGDACDFPGGVAGCEPDGAGCVLLGCVQPFGDCDAFDATGCEKDLSTSIFNCGACGRSCESHNVASGGAACSEGTCKPTCNLGWGDCSQPQAPADDDGCETNLLSSAANCGVCGYACSANHAVAQCQAGACAPACDSGWGDCATPARPDLDDGCESSITSDPFHCGACGRTCDTSNVISLACSGGVCTSSCVLGYANCSMPAANSGSDDGCETDARDDSSNCGGCGNQCAQGLECGEASDALCSCTADATSCGLGGGCTSATGQCTCGNTQCAIGERCTGTTPAACSCNGGAPCTQAKACCEAGCVNLLYDAGNCGACGHACTPGFVCAGGTACKCDGDADCDAGTPGTCTSGHCYCSGDPGGPSVQCGYGQRCQPDGKCG
jgi:hypothetical protein